MFSDVAPRPRISLAARTFGSDLTGWSNFDSWYMEANYSKLVRGPLQALWRHAAGPERKYSIRRSGPCDDVSLLAKECTTRRVVRQYCIRLADDKINDRSPSLTLLDH